VAEFDLGHSNPGAESCYGADEDFFGASVLPMVEKSSLRADALNLPNLLTMLRVALIPVFLWILAEGTPEAGFLAACVYIATAVTDFLDGWLARRMGLVSILGKFLDPLADKLMVMASLVFLTWMGRLPLWGAIIVILMEGRELAVTSLRVIAISEGVVMAAVRGGKEKTAVQMVAILMLIVYHRFEVDFFFTSVSVHWGTMGLMLLAVSAVMSITSAGEYVKLFVEAVEAKERRLAEARGRGEDR